MNKVEIFQKKYPKFIYENYSYRISKNNLEIFFSFKIEPKIYFSPKVTIENINKNQIAKIEKNIFDNLIFHLGLMEIPSYWKATCSSIIEILAGELDKWQIKWWKDLIIKGMGQFFFENKIDFRKPNFLQIISYQSKKNVSVFKTFSNAQFQKKEKVLVPIGGGKDSIVTLEILKRAEKKIGCFSLNPTFVTQKIIKSADCKNFIIVKRKIDERLLELNRQGFLNGHTPFSAYLAFLSVLIAVIFDYKFIAFSNERSSNEGNLKYLRRIINHQWSKSFEFEENFRKYSKKYLNPEVEYFSFLRPLYEIQIAKLFSKYPKYFPVFLSCNTAFKTASGRKKPLGKWCGNCPKCLFTFTILYPFIKREKLIKIFGKNLFEKKELLPIMEELIGLKKFKPFECVGTKKESLIAFYLSLKKTQRIGESPFLLKYFQNKILPQYPNLEVESKKIFNSWNNQNNLPKEFAEVLKTYH